MIFSRQATALTSALRILVVDDDAVIGTLLAAMLEDMGHVVCGIETTEAGAVAAALRDRPDLMIVDALLGEGSGEVAMDRILQDMTMAHILMSGGTLTRRHVSSVILRKPFLYAELAGAIERATTGSSADIA